MGHAQEPFSDLWPLTSFPCDLPSVADFSLLTSALFGVELTILISYLDSYPTLRNSCFSQFRWHMGKFELLKGAFAEPRWGSRSMYPLKDVPAPVRISNVIWKGRIEAAVSWLWGMEIARDHPMSRCHLKGPDKWKRNTRESASLCSDMTNHWGIGDGRSQTEEYGGPGVILSC